MFTSRKQCDYRKKRMDVNAFRKIKDMIGMF